MTLTDATPIRVARRGEHTTRRLACFPHAGGAAEAFTALAGALPDDVEVLAFQYPGRRERRGEPAAGEIAELADEAARVLAGVGADVPLSLLGHSMGALVAFETARRIELGGGSVERLHVSAARSPAADWEERDLDALSDAEIVAELRRLGGVPEMLLQEPDVVAEILRLLRADHRALRRYQCAGDAVVTAPITALLADADPKNTAEQMREWSQHTSGGFRLEVLAGGHFALTERTSSAARLIGRAMKGAGHVDYSG